jgi:hypothetical protein
MTIITVEQIAAALHAAAQVTCCGDGQCRYADGEMPCLADGHDVRAMEIAAFLRALPAQRIDPLAMARLVQAVGEAMAARARVARVGAAVIGGALGLLLLGVLVVALAHQAPSGWSYDAACCSDSDCAMVPPGAIREASGGYAVEMVPRGSDPVRAFIPHGDERIRPSGDEFRHACIGPHTRQVICIYVPAGAV